MKYSGAMVRCLEELDTVGLRRLWGEVAPHLPLPATDADMLVSIHHARTQAQSVRFKLRAYSHRWLVDNGYPSGLPDHLKPRAERIYPRIADAVGVSVSATSAILKPVAEAVGMAMSNAVADCYANGDKDPLIVKPQMFAARDRARKFFADLFREAAQHSRSV